MDSKTSTSTFQVTSLPFPVSHSIRIFLVIFFGTECISVSMAAMALPVLSFSSRTPNSKYCCPTSSAMLIFWPDDRGRLRRRGRVGVWDEPWIDRLADRPEQVGSTWTSNALNSTSLLLLLIWNFSVNACGCISGRSQVRVIRQLSGDSFRGQFQIF